MGNIQTEITRIGGAKTTLGDYLKANGITVAAGEKIDVLAEKLTDIPSLSLDSLSITTAPTKTEYTAGDTFDPAGMVVTANFSNDASLNVTNYTYSPSTLTLGDTAVTVSLTFGSDTKSVLQAVTVQEKKSMSYSGNHTTKEITVNGVTYTQYTITGSGTLTVEGNYTGAMAWGCGGGAAGSSGYGSLSSASGGYGGGGGYANSYSGNITEGTYVITVGAASGVTSIASILSANGASGKNGGTGGGGSGKGDGKSKYPFDDTVNFDPHCGGGGGGQWSFRDVSKPYADGGSEGNGGTNGGNGGSSGSTGGAKGGGNGGYAGSNGNKATFYGSGGGGGGGTGSTQYSGSGGVGGAGYQGVVYIRVPV